MLEVVNVLVREHLEKLLDPLAYPGTAGHFLTARWRLRALRLKFHQ
jgi:hypothetical protein